MVTGLQRIWMLCLLVFAGSGPLPLWLHDIVCHGHRCQGVTYQGHGCQEPKGKERSQLHACCGHKHSLLSKHAAPKSSDRKAAKPVVWQAGSECDDECAVCYMLSQVSTATRFEVKLVGYRFSQQVSQPDDSRPSLRNWLAYASRGPPVV